MTPPRSEGYVGMPDAEFEAIVTRAAEEGAKRALADVGLDGDEAALDIRDPHLMLDLSRIRASSKFSTAASKLPASIAKSPLAKSFLLSYWVCKSGSTTPFKKHLGGLNFACFPQVSSGGVSKLRWREGLKRAAA